MAIDKRILAAGGIVAVAGALTLGQLENKDVPEILTATQEIKIAKTGDEITALRTTNSETYKITEYKLRTKVYNKLIYYPDSETGKYEKPDITVKEISALSKLNPFRSHDKYINAGAYSASWLNSDESDYKFTDSKDGYIKYDTCHKTDGIAVFKQVSEIGVKQSYVMLDSKADNALKWLLDASGKIELQKDGSVIISGSDIIIPAPIAWDNKRNSINITVSVIGDTLIYEPDLKGAVFPVTIDPSTTVTAYNDGRIEASGISYSASRNAKTGTAASNLLSVGQYTTGSNSWYNNRSVLSFTLPNMVSATACTLFVNGRTNQSTYDFTANIYGASAYLPTLDASDFVNFDGYNRYYNFTGEVLGTWSSASYSADWNPFIFTAAGLDSLETASADTIGLALVSENDVNYDPPTTLETVYFESSAKSGSEPYLVIDYTILSVPTGFAISDTTAISASFIWDDVNTEETGYKVMDLSGNIVATTAANDTVATISGLSPNTEYSYYIVAYAGTYTTAASDTVTFTTNKSSIVINCNAVSVYSGTVRSENANYNTGRNGVTGYSAGNIGNVGQWVTGSTYVNYRLFAQYNMTGVPVGAVIDSARFYFYCDTDSSTTDINLKLCMSNKTGGLSTSWFSQFYGWASSGAYSGIKQIADDWNTSLFAAGWKYTDITAAGLDSLTNHIGEVIETVLMSSKDISATAPVDAEFITISNTNLPYLKVYIHPEVPHSVTVTSIAPDSLLVTWEDWTGDETGFRIIDADTDAAIDSTSSDAVSKEIGGLSANTLYRIKLQVKGGVLDGEYSAVDSCYTRANVPGAVTITFPADSLLKFVFNVNSNPAHTEFAIQDSITGKYVQKITGLDTLGATEMWGTSAFWGGANGDTVKIYPGKKYTIRVKARSGE